MKRVEEANGARLFGPAFVDDSVAGHIFCAFVPGGGWRGGVVWVIVDVTDFGVAFWVWGWRSGSSEGGGTASEGWRVGVKDDLVVGSDPAYD